MTAKVPTDDAPKELQQGVQVQLSNGLTAVVKEVTPEHVLIDANHTLAGKALTFDVELIQLQKVCCECINWQQCVTMLCHFPFTLTTNVNNYTRGHNWTCMMHFDAACWQVQKVLLTAREAPFQCTSSL